MAKLQRVSRKPIYIILAISLLIAIGYASFRSMYPPQTSEIFEITPSSVEYGYTTLTGRLTKDTPVGQKGSYLLALPDMRFVYLTIENIDSLVGQNVAATGILAPSDDPAKPMIMVVDEIRSL